MARLEVRLLGDPVLRRKAEPVGEITDELRALIDSMFETMYAEEGVGLAGPQVGEEIRVVVIDPHEEEGPGPTALINPEVVSIGSQTKRREEGCLSIPGVSEIVERPDSVVIEALDREGKSFRIEAEGLLACILQHEIDHLDGVLFIDRLSPIKRRMLISKWQKSRTAETRG